MDNLSIIKALSNETRFRILEWLKEPEVHFGPQDHLAKECNFEHGICVGSIAEKAGLAQSVISGYLVKLQKSGLLQSKRVGQWTYYRRDEDNIRRFKESVQTDL
jgi:DNA-binding transcriptional ArsR family regulator